MKLRFSWLLLVSAPAFVACSDPFVGAPGADAGGTDGITARCVDIEADEDADGIPNGIEQCRENRDTDNDGVPDWQDFDSDDDGLSDSIEKGLKDAEENCASAEPPKNSWPCDTDGDDLADYIDLDSDGDGVDDGAEDSNGDGVFGCCITTCGQFEGKQDQDCRLTVVGDRYSANRTIAAGEEGCGPGQLCEAGSCVPQVAFLCSNGETNPLLADTYNDGVNDSDRGTFICRDATEDKPRGRKPIQTHKSTVGDWNVAMEKSALYGAFSISDAGTKMAAAAIQEEDASTLVAGFVVSLDSSKSTIDEEMAELLGALTTNAPGGGVLTVRASGATGKSHDRYDTVKGTYLELDLAAPSNASTVRDEVVAALLGKTIADLGSVPTPFGSNTASRLVIRMVTVKRFAFKRDAGNLVLDAKGNPVDSGDKSQWRLVIMGAVAEKNDYEDSKRPTGLIVDDLSNGTSLATASDTVGEECDVGRIERLGVADVVWVVDESGSMNDNRADLANNAAAFFSRALAAGLDFRMGVTNVVNPNGSYRSALGKFCSKVSGDIYDDGGEDRFLLPTEQSVFSSCVNNPAGYAIGLEHPLKNAEAALTQHLPRAANDPQKFREGAVISFITATDEMPYSLLETISLSNAQRCVLPPAIRQELGKEIQPYLDLFSGASVSYHVISGTCQSSCKINGELRTDIGHGMIEIAQALGGQVGDICQKDLGKTLQVIINNILGEASPLVLEYVPISTSLAVAIDGVQLDRSRTKGFDYNGPFNSVVLNNVPIEKGQEVVASYKRWEKQLSIK